MSTNNKIPASCWIKITEDNLPPFNEYLLCFLPNKPGTILHKNDPNGGRKAYGYLFRLKPNERYGFIDGENATIKDISLAAGGNFWAFPYIARFEDVTHFALLPDDPVDFKEGQVKERINYSAIWYKDGNVHTSQPVSTGIIFTGKRHADCYDQMDLYTGQPELKEHVGRDCQGFLTSLNRWVDRKEGFYIAKAAGQFLHKLHDEIEPVLISEDLWP